MKSSARPVRGFDRYRLIDIAIRVALGVFYAFSAGANYRVVISQGHSIDFAHLTIENISHILSTLSIGFYAIMVAFLYVLRLRPVNKFAGVWPAIAAVLGGFLMYGVLWLKPRMDLPPSVQIMASLLILGGNIFAIYILTHLGKSFSILPEGRQLVTKGPYKIVRHPLYVAEAFAVLGTMILFLSPAAVGLVIVQMALQLWRIHYEELVLRKTFPEYKKYAQRTARLIPGVY